MKNTSEYNISSYTFPLSPDFPSKLEGITWCVAFALETILVVVGNLLTVALFAVDKKLRKKSLFLVINMAFADLLFGVVCLPLYIYFLGNYHRMWIPRMKKPLQRFSVINQMCFSQVTVISAALISCERFYAVYCPLKHRTLSARVYYIVMFMIWTLAILVGFLMFFLSSNSLISLDRSERTFSLLLYYSFFLLIVCGCNVGIWTKLHHRVIAFQPQNRVPQNQRLTKTLLFVAVFGLMSLLPYLILGFLMSFYDVSIHWSLLQTVALLCFSNGFVNPIVYALRIPEFRQALGLCQFRRHAVIANRECNEIMNNRAAALVPGTRLRTLQADRSHLQLECKQEVTDTKL